VDDVVLTTPFGPVPPAFIVPAIVVFGLMVGSFLNVCIGRIPAGESIVHPGSRCPNCRVPIRWYDNIPVLSYLVLGGRCRACHVRISPRYVFVEIATAIAFLVQWWFVGSDPLLLVSRLVFTALLIAMFGTDLETQRLPDAFTLPGVAVGILFSIWLPPGPIDSVLGAAVGAGILLALRWLWERLRGVEAMGLGDVKMLAMIGAFLGWRQVFVVLFLATLSGAVVGVALSAAKGRSLQVKLPFGTFLAVAAYVGSLVGVPLLDWYLGLYA
jgi:leader peptidase (prepilin peptidase)/N-methyltransferase